MSARRDIYANADLSPTEQENVRIVVRYLRTVFGGSWEVLAKQLRFEASTIIHVVNERRGVSPTMAFRVARLAKVSIDGLLAGRHRPPKNVCINCGFKALHPPTKRIFAE